MGEFFPPQLSLSDTFEAGMEPGDLTKRSALPWQVVEKQYSFEGRDGRQTLAELFDGRSQLIIYHFMFGPGWGEGCPHCSRWADSFDGAIVHLNQRDVTLADGGLLQRGDVRDRPDGRRRDAQRDLLVGHTDLERGGLVANGLHAQLRGEVGKGGVVRRPIALGESAIGRRDSS